MMFWRKRIYTPEPNFGIREIIITTIRNRLHNYIREGLDISNVETIAEEILTITNMRYEYHLAWESKNHEEVVRVLAETFADYERDMREGTFLSIMEYGI